MTSESIYVVVTRFGSHTYMELVLQGSINFIQSVRHENERKSTILIHWSATVWKRTNSLWHSDAIWRHRTGSTLTQVMACFLLAPSHNLNQCWLIISEVQWQSPEANSTRNSSAINYYNWLENNFEKMSFKSPRANELIKFLSLMFQNSDHGVCHYFSAYPTLHLFFNMETCTRKSIPQIEGVLWEYNPWTGKG